MTDAEWEDICEELFASDWGWGHFANKSGSPRKELVLSWKVARLRRKAADFGMLTYLEDRDALEAKAGRMAEALEGLLAVQNGPPLIAKADEWQEAVDKARAVLEAAGLHENNKKETP